MSDVRRIYRVTVMNPKTYEDGRHKFYSFDELQDFLNSLPKGTIIRRFVITYPDLDATLKDLYDDIL